MKEKIGNAWRIVVEEVVRWRPMARTEKEKKSSGVLQKSKNQKETRAWKNKWISKVKMGFLFNFSNRVSPKKIGPARFNYVWPSWPIGSGQNYPDFFEPTKIESSPTLINSGWSD